MDDGKEQTRNFKIVAAIEIGPVFSAYAYSTVGDFQKDPLHITQKQHWYTGNKSRGREQTSTSILLDCHRRFKAFGFEAQDEHLALKHRKKDNQFLFFRHFYVQLYNAKEPLSKLELQDTEGHGKVPAMDIFSMSINALKNELLQQLHGKNHILSDDDIRWVLPISNLLPADATFFFTECSKQAGIRSEQLVIVNDAEALSAYLKYLEPLDSTIKEIKEETEYIVVKMAGIVTETFVLNGVKPNVRQKEIKIQQLYTDSLNDLVDNDFWDVLISIFGGQMLNKIIEKKPSAFLRTFRKFLEIKSTLNSESPKYLPLQFPCKLIDIVLKDFGHETLREALTNSPHIKFIDDEHVSVKTDMISFQSAVETILFLLNKQLNDQNENKKKYSPCLPQGQKSENEEVEHKSLSKNDQTEETKKKTTQFCLLIGHLSENEDVKDKIQVVNPSIQIIVPQEATDAILKGAVMLGHDRKVIGKESSLNSKKRMGVNFSVVVAIDFGTAYSVYSWSTTADYQTKPLEIQTKTWTSGKEYKTNTSLLLDKTKRFVAFGGKAEDKYIGMSAKKREEMYYFENFKLNLYNSREPLSTLKIMDIQRRPDKSVLAQYVFATSIKALKDDAMEMLSTRGKSADENEVRWVLTVPAIWPEDAKMFMRETAKQAGISSNRLLLALEPEVASLYSQFQATQHTKGDGYQIASAGTKYVVVDVGGGTTDITVHEKKLNTKVKELNKASGGDCGGKSVDAEFFKLLDRMFGKQLMQKLREENAKSYLTLYRSFEEHKQKFKSETTTEICVRFPCQAFGKLFGDSEEFEKFTRKNNIRIEDGKLILSPSDVETLFQPTIKRIIKLIETALHFKGSDSVSFIMLVGGFANNDLLRKSIKEHFPNKRLIATEEAGLAVLKGAVLYGHDPESIDPRVTRYTYGVNCDIPFIDSIHEPTREYTDPSTGNTYCRGTFSTIIKQNTIVKLGTVVKKTYNIPPYTTETNFDFYTAEKDFPIYLDDPSCRKIGTLYISVPSPSDEVREVDVEYIFGNTEIEVRAKDAKYGVRATSNLTFD